MLATRFTFGPSGLSGSVREGAREGRADEALRAALTRTVFAQGETTLIFSFACLVLCAVLLRGTVPDTSLMLWFMAGATTVILRVPLVLRASSLPDAALPYRSNLVLVAFSGVVWGALTLLWTPEQDIATQLVLILFPLTMSIGAIVSYGGRVPLFLAFAIPAQLPLIAMFVSSLDPDYRMLALPTALFLGGQVVLVRRFNHRIRETVALRLGNEALVADLSARHESLSLARDEARIANGAKAAFLARMSDEVRTPIDGVLDVSELLARTGLDAEQSNLLATLANSARSLLELLDELLDISRVETGQLELETRDYAFRTMLERVLEDERAAAEARSLRLEWSVDSAVPSRLHGDPVRVGQIVRHLVDNAVRFTETGSVRVRVTAAGRERDASTLRLSVLDTGIGMSPERLGRMFEPIHRAVDPGARNANGIGLGLALVRELAALMGGEVRAESTPDVGSMFVVELPLVTADGPVHGPVAYIAPRAELPASDAAAA